MVQLLFTASSSATGISSFQAFPLAISGRVGTGNIAGVATAIGIGGPGAVFWMWVITFLGSSSTIILVLLLTVIIKLSGIIPPALIYVRNLLVITINASYFC